MNQLSNRERKILAFTHIKKAAGTTLSHILRINFFLRHCDVKVLFPNPKKTFKANDMNMVFKINPFIESIGGHSVVPFNDLGLHYKNMRFITLLRNPVERYCSQYQHNVYKIGYKGSFYDFLENPTSWNKQVRTIAGSDDLALAKKILIDKFLLVGIVEEFDEFLILLKKRLQPRKFNTGYRIENIGKKGSPSSKKVSKYLYDNIKLIESKNYLDIELYEFVKSELLPQERKKYGPKFSQDLANFKHLKKDYNRKVFRHIDYCIRSIYYRPMINMIRRKNGLAR